MKTPAPEIWRKIKTWKQGLFGVTRVTPAHRQCHTIRCSAHDLLLTFHRNYIVCSFMYRYRDMANYLLKIAHFSYATFMWRPFGVIPLEFHTELWRQKDSAVLTLLRYDVYPFWQNSGLWHGQTLTALYRASIHSCTLKIRRGVFWSLNLFKFRKITGNISETVYKIDP